jgi:hypothetical protein
VGAGAVVVGAGACAGVGWPAVVPGAGGAPMPMLAPQLMACPVAGACAAPASPAGVPIEPGACPMFAPHPPSWPMFAPQPPACPVGSGAGVVAVAGAAVALVGGWAIAGGGLLAHPSTATPPRAADTINSSFARVSLFI